MNKIWVQTNLYTKKNGQEKNWVGKKPIWLQNKLEYEKYRERKKLGYEKTIWVLKNEYK